jgi:hypothetical protein
MKEFLPMNRRLEFQPQPCSRGFHRSCAPPVATARANRPALIFLTGLVRLSRCTSRRKPDGRTAW